MPDALARALAGATVVTPNRRLARHLTDTYDRAQVAAGLRASVGSGAWASAGAAAAVSAIVVISMRIWMSPPKTAADRIALRMT